MSYNREEIQKIRNVVISEKEAAEKEAAEKLKKIETPVPDNTEKKIVLPESTEKKKRGRPPKIKAPDPVPTQPPPDLNFNSKAAYDVFTQMLSKRGDFWLPKSQDELNNLALSTDVFCKEKLKNIPDFVSIMFFINLGAYFIPRTIIDIVETVDRLKKKKQEEKEKGPEKENKLTPEEIEKKRQEKYNEYLKKQKEAKNDK